MSNNLLPTCARGSQKQVRGWFGQLAKSGAKTFLLAQEKWRLSIGVKQPAELPRHIRVRYPFLLNGKACRMNGIKGITLRAN